jgi:hypothetical protein
MLFLNIWLLLGALGISIPVIIHILNRRHAKQVDWGAMRFLLDSVISRRRRVLLEEMLLLATRCLLVALIALALARPFVSAASDVPWVLVLPVALLAVALFGVSFALWRYPLRRFIAMFAALALIGLAVASVLAENRLNLKRFGGGARDVAIVIDGSSSMTMAVAGETNFARAVKEAESYIESVPRGFAFSLIVAGSVPNVLTSAPTPDRKRLSELLKEAKPVQGTMQALDTLAVAATTLARGNNLGKQIIMIGDGQSVGWQTEQTALWEMLRETFAHLPTPPEVVWRRLPMPETIRNATLSRIALSRQVVGTDREVRIDVTIRNTGGESITPQEVELTIGETMLSDRSLGQLAPGASATVNFLHRFEKTGTAVIHAHAVTHDEMPGDDDALHVVQVMDRLRVLIVDAAKTADFLERGGGFVTLALMPDMVQLMASKKTTPEREFLVTPELLSVPELIARGSVEDASVVVLVDVPALPPLMANSLARFVAHGGGLLVAPGESAMSAFYNGWESGGEPVMPLTLDTLMRPEEADRPSLALHSFEHPALLSLVESDLDAVQFQNYWRSQPSESAVVMSAANFANGDIFLAERAFGRGVVVQVNAPLNSRAGNLVARQGFVPLVHELVYHLARPVAAKLNLPPSRGATLQLAGASAVASEGGIRGEYFNSPTATKPFTARTDASVSAKLGWPQGKPPGHGFWVLWTGTLAVPKTGTYTFQRGAESRILLKLNGRTLLERSEAVAEIELDQEERYDIRVEFRAPPNASRTPQLTVAGPGLPTQEIPSAFLSPERKGEKKTAKGIETTVQGPAKQALTGYYVSDQNGAVALRIDDNLVPGLYVAEVPRQVKKSLVPLLGEDGKIHFSVKIDGEESRLEPLTPEDSLMIASYLNFLEAGSAEDVLRALRGKAFGRELWRNLAIAALVLVLLEVLLTRWISIQRRAGEPSTVIFEKSTRPSSEFSAQLDNLGGGK